MTGGGDPLGHRSPGPVDQRQHPLQGVDEGVNGGELRADVAIDTDDRQIRPFAAGEDEEASTPPTRDGIIRPERFARLVTLASILIAVL